MAVPSGEAAAAAGNSLQTVQADARIRTAHNKADLKKYLQLVESLRSAGVLSRYVDFWGRRDYLNTRATAALAADPKARPDWFQDFLELAELEAAFLFSPQSPIWPSSTTNDGRADARSRSTFARARSWPPARSI